jgi:hypothetical protein
VNLQQEYFLRNRVSAPYVFHGSSQLLLHNDYEQKTSLKYKWFYVKFINKEGQDGSNIGRFDVTIGYPSVNLSPPIIFGNLEEITVYWEDYEKFVHSKVAEWKRQKWRALSKPNDLKLACWEILSYNQDLALSSLPIAALDMNYIALDYQANEDKRLTMVDMLVKRVSAQVEAFSKNHLDLITSAWSLLSELMSSSRYASWLVNLVNR